MIDTGLNKREMGLICGVLRQHPEITGAILFGSRAKGVALSSSDIDLAIDGIDDALKAEALARELDELPLPYRFDVLALSTIRDIPLREHIERVGVRIHG